MNARLAVSRRTLLIGAVASVAAPWVVRGVRPAWADTAPAIGEAAWEKLGRQITGGVMRPNDPRFYILTRPENLRYYHPQIEADDPRDPDAPFGVVRPRHAGEVAAAILWARENNCPMVARSGGHSYAGCSTVPGLVVHGGAMRQVRYDAKTGLLEMGGGVLNEDVFNALKQTDRAIVHGRCLAVGISAFLMGGGIGLAMREHGVGCDLMRAVELVLADGRKVVATVSNEYKDLFWAVRGGGGGNLGFATRWWLQTVSGGKSVAFVAHWGAEGATKPVFERLVRALEESPEQMGAQMSLAATSRNGPWPNGIDLIGQFHGSRSRFDRIFGAALEGSSHRIAELPYWQAQEFFEIEAAPNRYQETSIFADEVNDACIEEAFAILRDFPRPGQGARARLTFFLTGGKINKTRPDATAFVHRSSQWLINPILEWDEFADVGEHLRWQRQAMTRFGKLLGGTQSYQNFPDPELDGHEHAYWGGNLARLSRIKARVDPTRVFTPPRNQGIPFAP